MMLKGKNVVIIKGEKGTPPIVTDYDRVYLENASTDKLEEYEKTSDGKPLEVAGKVWKGTKPAGETTVPAEDLLPEALGYFQATYPISADKLKDKTPEQVGQLQSNHAWMLLLEAASYGNDLWTRNKIQSDVRPSKPIDEATAVEKAVKLVMSLNPKLTREKALVIAKAMTAASTEESVAA